MKRLTVIALTFLLFSCSGMYPGGLALSLEEAEASGSLIAKYKASEKTVEIDGTEFLLAPSWTAYPLIDRRENTISKTAYSFLVPLKDKKTGALSTENQVWLPDHQFVKYNGKKYGNTIGVGIYTGMYSVDYLTENLPVSPDTISLTFESGVNSKTVLFTKIKK